MPTEIMSPLHLYRFLADKVNPYQEEFWVICCNSENVILSAKALFRGTVNRCEIHPRDIVRFLALSNASSFFIAHNHPTGLARPSRPDLHLTRRILKLSEIVQIPLIDHLILSTNDFYSMAEQTQIFSKNRGPS